MGESPENMVKGFRVVDERKGIFSLYDKVFNKHREWQISEEVPAGYAYLNDQLNKEGEWIRKKLPDNFYSLSKKEREQILNEKIDQMPEEERIEYLMRMQRNSAKQLALTCSYIEPLHDIPDIWNEKIEHFAACLTSQSDINKINDFFLKSFNGTTTSPAEKESKKKPNQ